jgi:ABC-type protease/lipase transport system fused ATPase/permease subunit
MMDNDKELPPRPGEEKVKKQIQSPVDAIPLYVKGMNFPLSEGEALGVISQLASALQTRSAGITGVVRNG